MPDLPVKVVPKSTPTMILRTPSWLDARFLLGAALLMYGGGGDASRWRLRLTILVDRYCSDDGG